MMTMAHTSVQVQRGKRGGWDVSLPDRSKPVHLETLDDARRVAYLSAAHRHPCELVVRDAYDRVLYREFIDDDGDDG